MKYIKKSEQVIETVFDKSSAYHKYFAEIFEILCPNVPVNIINAGISGATAPHSLAMLIYYDIKMDDILKRRSKKIDWIPLYDGILV